MARSQMSPASRQNAGLRATLERITRQLPLMMQPNHQQAGTGSLTVCRAINMMAQPGHLILPGILLMKLRTGYLPTIRVPLSLEPAGVSRPPLNGSTWMQVADGQTG